MTDNINDTKNTKGHSGGKNITTNCTRAEIETAYGKSATRLLDEKPTKKGSIDKRC